MNTRRLHLLAAALGSAFAVMVFVLAWQRYATFHNRTFDLAFYSRIAWGLPRGKLYDSIVGGHVLGLHLSVVLLPLGALGTLLGNVRVLLFAQALAYGLSLWPIARFGERRLGAPGFFVGALLWLLYPNLGHVLAYEFHPGTLAVLPLALAVDALDRRHAKHFVWSVVFVLCCREDLALVTALLGGLAMLRGPSDADASFQRLGRTIAIASLVYFGVFAVVLHPLFAPENGSMVLHFGAWGKTVPEAAWFLLTHPWAIFQHLGTPHRLSYLPKILMPLALVVPLLGWRFLIPTLPILAINLFSQFPTTLDLDSHYLTPAIPFLVAATLDGAARILKATAKKEMVLALLVPVVAAHVIAGGTYLSLDRPVVAFQDDENSRAARRLTSMIPDDVSVQAPDAMLPHIAEREFVYRAPPPEHRSRYTILDLSHRSRLRHRGDLLRATEEPFARDWLSRSTQEILAAEGPFVLTRATTTGARGLGDRYVVGRDNQGHGYALTACLAVTRATLRGRTLAIDFASRGACESDLGLRVGADPKPRRIDLLFDGLLSPVRLRVGERARSTHELSDDEVAAVRARGLYLGLVRQSEARPVPTDPDALQIPLS